MRTMLSWFDADKEGLAQIAKRKGPAHIGYELVQNALDTGAHKIEITFEPVVGRPQVWLHVRDDDPDGFKNLSHAWTLFAPSEKKGDPTKRGFMNLGEKLVLAMCDEAHIVSTKGSVHFMLETGRTTSKSSQVVGTTFSGLVRMTRSELDEVKAALRLLMPPEDVVVTLDGERLPSRRTLHTFSASVKTVLMDDDGYMKPPSPRVTEVRVYEPIDGVSRLYEMGIPVVEIPLPWSVEVMQKVPVNADRDNVTPAWGRDLAVLVVNEMHKHLKPEEAVLPGVQAALADPGINAEAVNTILTHQHGENRVVYDPRDPEANAKAFADGNTVIRGSAYSKDQWVQIRRSRAALASTSAGYASRSVYSDDPNAPTADTIDEGAWTPGMKNMADYAAELGQRLLKRRINVRFEKRFGAIDAANYGKGGSLCFNVSKLGYKWFDQGATESVNDLLIHEFAHEYGTHLTKEFDDAMSRLGAKMVSIALCEPEFYRKYYPT